LPSAAESRQASTHGGGHQDSFYGTPEILATGGRDVTVTLDDCCYVPSPAGGGAVVFNSTNDGETFGSETPAGTAPGVDAAALSDGQAVVADTEEASLSVQAFPTAPTSVASTVAEIYSGDTSDTSMTPYRGGILIAWDSGTNTFVDYAPSGSDFNDASAWHRVDSLPKQTVVGVSSAALVTDGGKPTTESSAGKFSFTLPGETDTYRVTVAYDPGYYQYGYSNSVTLTATS
jgi:hypothetical protein